MTEYISGKGIVPLLNNRNIPLVGAEVGVDSATTTEYILRMCPLVSIYAIDPWTAYSDVLSENISQEHQDKHYQQSVDKLTPYGDRVSIVRMTSMDAVKLFDDCSLDFLFIDGSHNYENVLEDLIHWYPKLKLTGLLSGHDIGVPSVYKAMTEFSQMQHLEYIPLENSAWYAQKKIPSYNFLIRRDVT